MKLWPHQKRLIEENPSKAILNWEMRVGKTLPAAKWIDHPKRIGNTYIVTPKQNKKDWVNMKTKAIVLTKEEFKKTTIVNPTAMIIDEGHYFASALFVRKGKGRSQLAEKLYNLVRKYPEMDLLILTATAIRQNAWSLHTLLCYIGEYYDWKKWRDEFFVQEYMPFLPTQPWMKPGELPTAWVPKKDWRINIRKYLEKHCDIVSLRDIVEDLPPIEPTFITIKQPKYIRPKDEIVNWMHEHQHEQQNKHKEILNLGYRKILVVAYYRDQIDSLKKELEKDRPVFVLDGRTKDADTIKKEAQEADDCYFIVQSQMGFGFDGWMFSAMVFASMAHKCLDHTQMLGRLRHLEHLKSLPVYYLFGGKWDKRIYETINKGQEFNPHIYERDATGTSTTE